MLTKRQGIIIWLRHSKYARRLRRYGHLIYTSKKQKYSLIYVDQDEIENTVEQLQRLNFVRKVEVSYKPSIETVYQTKVHEKEKEYEFKNF
ncbi:YlbG family protein [Bacillaceae bacterium W0354]